MRQSKGFTLIEVLASVVILAIAVSIVIFLLQQTTFLTKNTEHTDSSVLVTRTVMEEIKYNLKNTDTLQVYDQNISLIDLRVTEPSFTLSLPIYYPSDSNRQLRLDISSELIPNSEYVINGYQANLYQYFRLIKITSTNLSNSQTFELESYIEWN